MFLCIYIYTYVRSSWRDLRSPGWYSDAGITQPGASHKNCCRDLQIGVWMMFHDAKEKPKYWLGGILMYYVFLWTAGLWKNMIFQEQTWMEWFPFYVYYFGMISLIRPLIEHELLHGWCSLTYLFIFSLQCLHHMDLVLQFQDSPGLLLLLLKSMRFLIER